jgi:plasmid stability protein
MASLTVRIGEESHKALREIAARSGKSMRAPFPKGCSDSVVAARGPATEDRGGPGSPQGG